MCINYFYNKMSENNKKIQPNQTNQPDTSIKTSTTEKVLIVLAFVFILILFIMVIRIHIENSQIKSENKAISKITKQLTNIEYVNSDEDTGADAYTEINGNSIMDDTFILSDNENILSSINNNTINNELNYNSIQSALQTISDESGDTSTPTLITTDSLTSSSTISKSITIDNTTASINNITCGTLTVKNLDLSGDYVQPRYLATDWSPVISSSSGDGGSNYVQWNVGNLYSADMSNGSELRVYCLTNIGTGALGDGDIYDISGLHVISDEKHGFSVITSEDTVSLQTGTKNPALFYDTVSGNYSNSGDFTDTYYKICVY